MVRRRASTSGDKSKNMRPSVSRVGRNKWETSVKASGQEHVSRETSKETSGDSGDKCKNIRPSVIRVGRDKSETSVDKCNKCKTTRPRASGQEYLARDKQRETTGDKCKNIPPSVSTAVRDKWVTSGDKCNKKGTSRETRERQVETSV